MDTAIVLENLEPFIFVSLSGFLLTTVMVLLMYGIHKAVSLLNV